MFSISHIAQSLKELLPARESPVIREIKEALRTANRLRHPDHRAFAIVQDYPLMCELAKAYVNDGDFESAQDIIRICFKMSDEYASWSGHRNAFLIRKLCKEFIEQGREDIAQKIMRKAQNFEAGVPLHLLSATFIPDREKLAEEVAAAERPKPPPTS